MPPSHAENNGPLFTNKAFVLVIIALFSLTIAVLLFASSLSVSLCSQLSKQTELCHFGVSVAGASAAGAVAAARWHFRSSRFEKVYLSLAATATGGFAFFIHTTSQAYSETTRVIHHIQQLVASPLHVAECLRNETGYSLSLLRKSLSQNPAVDINRGVIEIVRSVTRVNLTQDELKQAVSAAFNWLESRGMGCKKAMSQPFIKCLSATESAKKDCLITGSGALCNAVDVGASICKLLQSVNEAVCLNLGPDTVATLLSGVRKQMANFVDGAIRMRVGVLIELRTTSRVEEKLGDAWRPFRDALNRTCDIASSAFYATQLLVRHAGITAVLVWPIAYLAFYLCGPLSFDNQYFPATDRKRFERTIVKLDDAEERVDSSETIPTAISLLPTRAEAVKLVRSLVLTSFDLFIVGAVLALDYYLTLLIDQLTASVKSVIVDKSAGFDRERQQQKIEGIEWIERVITQQLETLHNAVGLSRLVHCIQPPPPIDYSYTVFYLAVAQRFVSVIMRIKYPYLPSMICARFYGRRHKIRMRYLKVKKLREILERKTKSPSAWSLLKQFFSNSFFYTRCHFTTRKFFS